MSRRLRFCLLAILGLCLVSLVYLLCLSPYARPVHDDFYFLTPLGSATPQSNWGYWNRNGRLTDTAIYSLLYPVPHIIQLTPIVTIMLVFAGFFSVAYALLKHYSKIQEVRLLSVTTASLLTLTAVMTAPSIYASFYWLAGGVPHTWAAALVLIYIGLVLARLKKSTGPKIWKDIGAFFILPLVIGDAYESASLTIIALSVSIIVFIYWKKIKVDWRVLWFSLTAGLGGLLIELFSPGALDRQKATTGGGMINRLPGIPGDLWQHWTSILPHTLLNKSMFVILFLIGLLIGLFLLKRRFSIRSSLYLALTTVAACVMVVSVNIAAQWLAMGAPLQVRSYFTATAWIALGCLLVGVVAGQAFISKQKLLAYLSFIFILAMLTLNQGFMPYLNNVRTEFTSFSNVWDSSNTYVTQAVSRKQCRIPISSIDINGTANVQPNIRYWMNNEIDHYYSIRKKVGHKCGVVSNGAVRKFFFYSSVY